MLIKNRHRPTLFVDIIMCNFYIWSLYTTTLLVSLFARSNSLKEGELCQIRKGEKGVCEKFSNCRPAVEDYYRRGKWPLFCSFQGLEMIVCCDKLKNDTTTESTSTTDTATSTTTTTTTTTTMDTPIEGPGRIATKKCREYSSWLDSPILLGGVGKIPGVCGITVEKFIVGGQNATELEFPHMAHLGYGQKDLSFVCGASLISHEYLLTAAHCLEIDVGPLRVARLGATGQFRFQKTIRIKKRIPHPSWSPRTRYDDIALLQLEEPLKEFTDYIRPACLQTEKEMDATEAIASGWGRTSFYGKQSDYLQKVKLPFQPPEECVKVFRKDRALPGGIDENSMLCAGGFTIKKDTCRGDSGGPLQIVRKKPDCMYNIVGITSFGYDCGKAPGVYTRVSNYVSWIESIVWPDE